MLETNSPQFSIAAADRELKLLFRNNDVHRSLKKNRRAFEKRTTLGNRRCRVTASQAFSRLAGGSGVISSLFITSRTANYQSSFVSSCH